MGSLSLWKVIFKGKQKIVSRGEAQERENYHLEKSSAREGEDPY